MPPAKAWPQWFSVGGMTSGEAWLVDGGVLVSGSVSSLANPFAGGKGLSALKLGAPPVLGLRTLVVKSLAVLSRLKSKIILEINWAGQKK